MEIKRLLKLRKKIKGKRKFKRQEYFRHKRLKEKWKKPKGRHSKLRIQEKARGRIVKIGYGSPRAVKGLTQAGYKPIRISNPKELEKIDPKKEVVIIASGVGKKKRIEIVKKADNLKIKILNM